LIDPTIYVLALNDNNSKIEFETGGM
jgi:hypothetical protein